MVTGMLFRGTQKHTVVLTFLHDIVMATATRL